MLPMLSSFSPIPLSAISALASSLLFGTSDYIGGHLAKKYKVLAVTGAILFVGFMVGVLMLLLTHTWIAPSLSWSGYFLPGVFAGLIGFAGLNAFFAGLATGRMGVVSPISSLAVIVPVIYSLINGERPSHLAIAGMIIAVLGAFFGSGPEIKGGLSVKPLVFAATSAICFGTSALFLTIGAKTNVLMTSLTMRLPSVIIIGLLALRFKSTGGFTSKSWRWLILAGFGDFLANVTLGEASTMGLVSSAVVLASLYPVITSLLAFKFSHERLHKIQYIGIIFAVTGVSLISLG
ncbi:MAG: DMT family transporter [Actinomycetes bacterium]